jgi:hypothetical protein
MLRFEDNIKKDLTNHRPQLFRTSIGVPAYIEILYKTLL